MKERIDGFLRRVQEHSGLLVMHSTGMVGFLHLTFQEYFAARYLVNDFDEAKDLLRLHRHKARWEEPLRLAIATQTGANAAKLIRAALWHKDGTNPNTGYVPYAHEEFLRRDLLLTARCLGDCAAIEPTLAREITDKLTNVCLNHNDRGNYFGLRQRAYATLPALASGEVGQEIQRRFLFALQDNNNNIRENAILALGRLGQATPGVIAALLAALQDTEENVRVSAVMALGRLGQATPDVVATLVTALKDTSGNVKVSAAQVLGQLGQATPEVIAVVLDVLQSLEWLLWVSAAEVLEQLGQATPDVVAGLLALIQDTSGSVQRSAIQALGQLGQATPDVIAALMTELESEYWSVQESAAIALRQLGQATPDVIAALLNALQDTEEPVQDAAWEALWTLTSDRVVGSDAASD